MFTANEGFFLKTTLDNLLIVHGKMALKHYSKI